MLSVICSPGSQSQSSHPASLPTRRWFSFSFGFSCSNIIYLFIYCYFISFDQALSRTGFFFCFFLEFLFVVFLFCFSFFGVLFFCFFRAVGSFVCFFFVLFCFLFYLFIFFFLYSHTTWQRTVVNVREITKEEEGEMKRKKEKEKGTRERTYILIEVRTAVISWLVVVNEKKERKKDTAAVMNIFIEEIKNLKKKKKE